MSHFSLKHSLATTCIACGRVTVSLEQTVNFTEALELIDLSSREQVFHAARSMLINRKEHLILFETLFNRFWQLHHINTAKGQAMPIAPRHNVKKRKQFNIVTYMAYKARQHDEEIEVIDKSGTFSNAEILQRKEFSQMAPEELENDQTAHAKNALGCQPAGNTPLGTRCART